MSNHKQPQLPPNVTPPGLLKPPPPPAPPPIVDTRVVVELREPNHEAVMERVRCRSAKPAYYAWIYWWLVPVAREHGYALALHGSMSRDLDVIAVPWTDEAVSAEELYEALVSFVPGWSRTEPTAKPHGRVAYQIMLGGGAYVDVSVMPRHP